MFKAGIRWAGHLCGLAVALMVGVGRLPATTYTASSGLQLRDALSVAQPGDTIALTAGNTFEGPFHLPAKTGTGWITLQTTNTAGLPPAGTRINPALHAGAMPKLVPAGNSTNTSDVVIRASTGAHHYRFVGVEIVTSRYITQLVQLGDWNESSISALPHSFIFERCYVHAGAPGARRGIAMNGGNGQVTRLANGRIDWANSEGGIQVVDSYFGNIVDKTYESQAVASWNGAGPFRLENNYFEASGENAMFGGGDPSIKDLIPSDIEVIGNHFKKPLEWIPLGYVVKNLFELKNARRVLVLGNVFENNWIGADQLGYAILFTPRNQGGRSSWSTVRDVEFAYNKVLNSPQGMTILGRDDVRTSQRLENVTIRHNVFDLHRPDTAGKGRLFQISNGAYNLTIDHNTGLQHRNVIFAYDSANDLFTFTNNLTRHNVCDTNNNNCGIAGNLTKPGDTTIAKYFPGGVFRQNVMFVGGFSGDYTKEQLCDLNGFPETEDQVGFDSDGLSLAANSPYAGKGVSDGLCAQDMLDIGADMAEVAKAATAALGGDNGGDGDTPNSPPAVVITSPASGSTVSGTVIIQVSASDLDGAVSKVEWNVDGGTWQAAAWNGAHYEATWDTTTASNGDHTINARATDNNGATGADSNPVTVSNTTSGGGMHAGDLDGSSANNGSTWTARVIVTAHDSNHGPLAGVSVSGSWSDGIAMSCSALTDAAGQCAVTRSGIPKRTGSLSYTVDTMSAGGQTYESGDNHDPDGDSDGTSIRVSKP
jgi:hypothetical protein